MLTVVHIYMGCGLQRERERESTITVMHMTIHFDEAARGVSCYDVSLPAMMSARVPCHAVSQGRTGGIIKLQRCSALLVTGVKGCMLVQAIVLAPHRALPHVAACISMGRLAVFSDAKTKVQLATMHVLTIGWQHSTLAWQSVHACSITSLQQ